ncbi:hypothetical protein [Anabaena sp. UHCC 0451]|uniref:tetratricopeptide repeat protein n=1 Tax=Anabaena sp. UHCC 0451 TaxID=2055235 RepID=UPI002B206B07|nr:hypothetical protein [Anabaena sp. UHCC 0451]MEA5576837.1 hypothetical protein [Anabaena sp. UHCC 0451]
MYQISVQRLILSLFVSLMAVAPVTAAINEPSVSHKHRDLNIIVQSNNIVGENPVDKTWNLIRTARQYAANGQKEQAFSSLLEAEKTARLSGNSATVDQLLGKIAVAQAKLGSYEKAIAITNSMSYKTMPPQASAYVPLRTETEIAIVNAYLQARKFNQAKQFAEGIKLGSSQNQVLIPIISNLADRGQFNEAIALTQKINEDYPAEKARSAIIKGYINTGRFNEAVAFTKTITNETEKLSALMMLSQWARRNGKLDIAYQTANQIKSPGGKIPTLIDVAIAYAQAKQQQKAISIISQGYENARKDKYPYLAPWARYFAQIGAFDRALAIANSRKDYEQADARLEIAREYSNNGQYANAISLTQLVKDGQLRVVRDIPDPKVETVNQIVRQAAKAGQYNLAIKAANSLTTGQYRVQELRTIAQQYQLTKQPQKAAAVLEEALKIARTVDRITIFYDRNIYFSVSNAGLLLDIARDYSQLNQSDRTIAILNEALTSAKTLKEENINSVREQVQYLNVIAKLYMQFGKHDQALASAESALKLVENLPKQPSFPSWPVHVLADVAEIFHIAQAGDKANQILTNAVSLSDNINDTIQKLWAKVAIVKAYATLNREQQIKTTVEAGFKLAQTLEPSQKDWLTDRLIVAAAASDPAYAMELTQKIILERPQQVSILAQIAINYHANGQHPQAQSVVIRLEDIAKTIADDDQSEQLLNIVIRNYFVPANIRNIPIWQLLQAGQINVQIQSHQAKAYNWSLIAKAYAFQGEAGRASQTMGFALDEAKNIVDNFERRDFLWQIFDEALTAGESSLAVQIANSFKQKSERDTAISLVQDKF